MTGLPTLKHIENAICSLLNFFILNFEVFLTKKGQHCYIGPQKEMSQT